MKFSEGLSVFEILSEMVNFGYGGIRPHSLG
jgi:hypothetical protein